MVLGLNDYRNTWKKIFQNFHNGVSLNRIEFLSTFHVQALSFWMTDLNTFTQSKSSNMNSEQQSFNFNLYYTYTIIMANNLQINLSYNQSTLKILKQILMQEKIWDQILSLIFYFYVLFKILLFKIFFLDFRYSWLFLFKLEFYYSTVVIRICLEIFFLGK